MSGIVIEGIQKTFGKSARALDGIDLTIAPGELLVLLGPSGCGKTTTLRSVAGLESPDGGRVIIGETVAFDAHAGINLRPEHRDIGMVFQNYALWPHMTVRKNIDYPLRARGMREKRMTGAVEDAAHLVGCGELLDRYPGQLSGGQQQRVALARALVAEPQVILFDEPLSNLDAKLRRELRVEIRRLHSRVGFTGIYVTHDQSEALAIADRVALVDEGRIVQVGSPDDVYFHPKTEWAAEFLGVTNRVKLQRTGELWTAGDVVLRGGPGDDWATGVTHVLHFRPATCSVRPQQSDVPADHIGLIGQVIDVSFGGEWIETEVAIGDAIVQSQELSRAADRHASSHAVGDAVAVHVPHSALITCDNGRSE